MPIKRDRRPDTPWQCRGITVHSSNRHLVGGLQQGQRSHALRQQAEHMTVPSNDQQKLKSILAQTETPTHDSMFAYDLDKGGPGSPCARNLNVFKLFSVS